MRDCAEEGAAERMNMAATQVALASLEARGVHIPCSYGFRKVECARTARLRGAPAHILRARNRLAGEMIAGRQHPYRLTCGANPENANADQNTASGGTNRRFTIT